MMKAKLVLFSKKNNELPRIGEMRPINMSPMITKLFELSISRHLKVAMDSTGFNKAQRDFRGK